MNTIYGITKRLIALSIFVLFVDYIVVNFERLLFLHYLFEGPGGESRNTRD